MPRPHRRSGTGADPVGAGRRHLAAIDPAVMRRVVGRPKDHDATQDGVRASASAVPAHRRAY